MRTHPLFTRRHYAAIAKVMSVTNNAGNPASDARWTIIRENLADMFAEDNESFNRGKFLDACKDGMEDE